MQAENVWPASRSLVGIVFTIFEGFAKKVADILKQKKQRILDPYLKPYKSKINEKFLRTYVTFCRE